jgi:hypothetical protein
MRVLLLAYELEAFSLCRLAKRLQEEGHKVLVVNCDYYNFIDSDWIRDYFSEQKFEQWTNFSKEYEELYEKEPDVDWGFLKEFEENKCVNKNINQLLMSDPVLARHHHHRDPYYTPIESEEQRYYWAERLIRWITNLIRDFNTDLIFTIKRTYFVKNVAAQISLATNIPMLTLIRSRLEDRCHIVDNFGYGTDSNARKYIDSQFNADELKLAREKISSFKKKTNTALYNAGSQEKISGGDLYSTFDVFKFICERGLKVGSKILMRKKREYRNGFFQGNYFNSHWPHVAYHYSRISYNRLKYIYSNPFEETTPTQPFVYFPLHTLPESSTLTLSSEYFEGDLIRYLSKECPAGLKIAVKENPNMVGIRPFRFYKRMKSIPNVRLLDPTVSSKHLIKESRGVCGISGTALLEAAMLDKVTHGFGHPEFESVLTYTGHAGVKPFLEDCVNCQKESSDKVTNYIKYLMDVGISLPLESMRTQPDSNEFNSGVKKMHQLLQAEIENRGYS